MDVWVGGYVDGWMDGWRVDELIIHGGSSISPLLSLT